jgi:hypothetical protein
MVSSVSNGSQQVVQVQARNDQNQVDERKKQQDRDQQNQAVTAAAEQDNGNSTDQRRGSIVNITV